jgi:hypothetical protein
MNSDDRIAELEAKVAQFDAVEARVQELTRLLLQQTGQPAPTVEVEHIQQSSRRGMLKLAGAAAVGTVVSTVAFGRPAAATTDEALVTGHINHETQQTEIRYGGAINTSVGPSFTGSTSMLKVDATASPSGTTVAVEARSNGIAMVANGVGGGVSAASGDGPGTYGFRSVGGNYSLISQATGKANLFLSGLGKTPPSQRVDDHLVGEVENVSGDLWMCVVAGTPGTWRKITGTAVAGAFHAISPSRVYDSRLPAPSPGALTQGANRLVSIADKRDLDTGAVTTANVVPAGATAISVNLTVTGTSGGGYLAVNEGGNNTIAASAINWTDSGLLIANSIIVPVNASRQVSVICGQGSTHFILDVSGYYL